MVRRKIIVSKYLVDVSAVPRVTAKSLEPWVKTGEIIIGGRAIDEDCHVISWGDPQIKSAYTVVETGFFWDAAHVDSVGLYRFSSLNTTHAASYIKRFKAPRSAADIILGGSLPASKYRQSGREEISWDGIVLACQNPADRSVLRGHSVADYWRFYEGACKTYGRHLFVKLHPWNGGDVERRMREIAAENGCRCEKTNHGVLKKAKFCLVFNSTFAVDCFVRRVPVAQFAPGYFWMSDAVTYTRGRYPDHVGDTRDGGSRMADFLIWRYCFNIQMPIDKWVRFFRHLSSSTAVFPISDEYAYATNLAHA